MMQSLMVNACVDMTSFRFSDYAFFTAPLTGFLAKKKAKCIALRLLEEILHA